MLEESRIENQPRKITWWLKRTKDSKLVSDEIIRRPYKSQMLPDIDYQKLYEEDTESLLALEKDVMTGLGIFLQAFEQKLAQARFSSAPDLVAGYLSAYLGFFARLGLGQTIAKELQHDIIELIKKQIDEAYSIFAQYPFIGTPENREKNFETLRNEAPCGIAEYTIGLTHAIKLIIENADYNCKLTHGTSLRKSPPAINPSSIDFVKASVEKSILLNACRDRWLQLYYIVNQMSLQIGWLVGHFVHLGAYHDKPLSRELGTKYLSHITPCFVFYLDV